MHLNPKISAFVVITVPYHHRGAKVRMFCSPQCVHPEKIVVWGFSITVPMVSSPNRVLACPRKVPRMLHHLIRILVMDGWALGGWGDEE